MTADRIVNAAVKKAKNVPAVIKVAAVITAVAVAKADAALASGCPAKKGMRPMPMMQAPRMQGNLPFYKDGNGNTIVIVNTGEEGSHGCKCGPDCKCKHHFKKGFHKHFGENPQVNEPEEAPAQPME